MRKSLLLFLCLFASTICWAANQHEIYYYNIPRHKTWIHYCFIYFSDHYGNIMQASEYNYNEQNDTFTFKVTMSTCENCEMLLLSTGECINELCPCNKTFEQFVPIEDISPFESLIGKNHD